MKDFLYLISLITVVFVVSATNSYPSESPTTVVISCLPLKKDMSDIGGTEQVELSKADQWNYRLEIIKKGDNYFWASRENKELIFSRSGEFYNFVEPNASGYIRVIKSEAGYLYMEHLTLALKNITYWGICNEHNLP